MSDGSAVTRDELAGFVGRGENYRHNADSDGCHLEVVLIVDSILSAFTVTRKDDQPGPNWVSALFPGTQDALDGLTIRKAV